jgi:P22_AR N-terminal domain
MTNNTININGITIECPEHEGTIYVAIKPICNILGIDPQKQFTRIKDDEILGQLYTVRYIVGSKDEKKRELFCIPVKYVFGWIFAIETNKVSEKSKPNFILYKKECYEALHNYFYAKENSRNDLYKEKAKCIVRAKELEAKLSNNKEYLELIDMKAEIMRIGKPIKQMDREILHTQLSLFNAENL